MGEKVVCDKVGVSKLCVCEQVVCDKVGVSKLCACENVVCDKVVREQVLCEWQSCVVVCV